MEFSHSILTFNSRDAIFRPLEFFSTAALYPMLDTISAIFSGEMCTGSKVTSALPASKATETFAIPVILV